MGGPGAHALHPGRRGSGRAPELSPRRPRVDGDRDIPEPGIKPSTASSSSRAIPSPRAWSVRRRDSTSGASAASGRPIWSRCCSPLVGRVDIASGSTRGPDLPAAAELGGAAGHAHHDPDVPRAGPVGRWTGLDPGGRVVGLHGRAVPSQDGHARHCRDIGDIARVLHPRAAAGETPPTARAGGCS